jgi:hypothetical protein
MKRIVDVYVESVSGSGNYSKLELFNDEKIELNSSIQNIQDISKVFTDFTQSFTIPASTINNSILHHFYQSDVDITKTTNNNYDWNFNFRINARIEIDLVPFRSGTILVEKANLKNGKAESYTITFYGNLLSLKDRFGDKKLSDLSLNDYDITYSGTEVVDRVTTTGSRDVMFPLVSSKRVWTLNDSTSTDINASTTAISYTELTPALKVKKIWDAIQDNFNIVFSSTFFTSTNDRWDKLYLLMKNEESYTNKTTNETLNILTPDGQSVLPYKNSSVPQVNGFYFDAALNTFTCQNVGVLDSNPILQMSFYSISDANVSYYIELYRNDKLTRQYEYKGVESAKNIYYFSPNDNGAVFKLKISSDTPITLSVSANLYYTFPRNQYVPISFAQVTTLAKTNLKSKCPDISVSDFFSGILKMFNATIIPTDANNFKIEPLDLWYNDGGIIDITRYVDIDSIDIQRQNTYKNLAFEYEKSQSFMNTEFRDKFSLEYGSTSFELSNEGTDFAIKLPFETMLTQNLNLDYLEVGYTLTKGPDYKPYVPKPILMYYDGFRPIGSVYINDGSSATQYSQLNIFNNNVTINSVLYSLVWDKETSTTQPFDSIDNTLYKTYYDSYLNNLFNPKSRLVNVKAHFPLSLITKLNLNDRLVIRDKRYVINDLKSDITSGEVSLTLINDFRPMLNDVTPEVVVSGGGTITKTIYVPDSWTESVDISTTTPGVTFSSTTVTSTSTIDITLPANSGTPTPIWSEDATDFVVTDDGYNVVDESGSGVVVPIDLTYNNYDGTTQINSFNLWQE